MNSYVLVYIRDGVLVTEDFVWEYDGERDIKDWRRANPGIQAKVIEIEPTGLHTIRGI